MNNLFVVAAANKNGKVFANTGIYNEYDDAATEARRQASNATTFDIVVESYEKDADATDLYLVTDRNGNIVVYCGSTMTTAQARAFEASNHVGDYVTTTYRKNNVEKF